MNKPTSVATKDGHIINVSQIKYMIPVNNKKSQIAFLDGEYLTIPKETADIIIEAIYWLHKKENRNYEQSNKNC
jgi:hypothetical protein